LPLPLLPLPFLGAGRGRRDFNLSSIKQDYISVCEGGSGEVWGCGGEGLLRV
jgi:hypothetical protein